MNQLYDRKIERAALGVLLAEPDRAKERLAELDLNRFTEPDHRILFNAVQKVVNDGGVPDPALLVSRLTTSRFAQLIGSIPDEGHPPAFEDYATRLKDLLKRRQLVRLSEKAIALANDTEVELNGAIPDFMDEVQRITAPPSRLPDIKDAADLLVNPPSLPPEVVEGVLHQCCKVVIGGGSKTNKTWIFCDLAVSVASGEPWLRHSVTRGRVLFVNLEIHEAFFTQRLNAVAEAKRCTIERGWLDTWNLRGKCADYQTTLPQIAERIRTVGYSLVIIDPIYKLLGKADENAARDIGAMMNAIEALATSSGAAIAIAAHFSKGNQAGKESIDRISGSGVFARDPDTIITLTAHQEENAYTVDAILRNHKPIAPFVVRWLFPLMRRDDDLDPKALKQPKLGRTPTYSEKDVLDCLPKGGLAIGKWQKRTSDKTGMSRSKFYEFAKKLRETGQITEDEDGLVQKVQNTHSGLPGSVQSSNT